MRYIQLARVGAAGTHPDFGRCQIDNTAGWSQSISRWCDISSLFPARHPALTGIFLKAQVVRQNTSKA